MQGKYNYVGLKWLMTRFFSFLFLFFFFFQKILLSQLISLSGNYTARVSEYVNQLHDGPCLSSSI